MATAKPAAAAAVTVIDAEKPGGALVAWKDKMAEMAKDVAAAERVGGNNISFRGGRLYIGEEMVPGDKMTVVVVNHVWEYSYYNTPYNADVPASPVCYAFGRDEDSMEIHGEDQQSDSCSGCPMNEWGSAGGGSRGKACKNGRKLALMHVDSLAKDIAKAEVLFARLPVTSVANFQKFATDAAKVLGVPPFGVIVEMSVVPNPKTQFQVHFKILDQIKSDAVLEALFNRHVALDADMRKLYPTNAELAEQRSVGGAAGSGGKKY